MLSKVQRRPVRALRFTRSALCIHLHPGRREQYQLPGEDSQARGEHGNSAVDPVTHFPSDWVFPLWQRCSCFLFCLPTDKHFYSASLLLCLLLRWIKVASLLACVISRLAHLPASSLFCSDHTGLDLVQLFFPCCRFGLSF